MNLAHQRRRHRVPASQPQVVVVSTEHDSLVGDARIGSRQKPDHIADFAADSQHVDLKTDRSARQDKTLRNQILINAGLKIQEVLLISFHQAPPQPGGYSKYADSQIVAL